MSQRVTTGGRGDGILKNHVKALRNRQLKMQHFSDLKGMTRVGI
jgi:hypothetical protein